MSSLDLDLKSPSEEGTRTSVGSSFSLVGVLDLEKGGVGDLGGRGRDFTAVILLLSGISSSGSGNSSSSSSNLLPLLGGVLDLLSFGSMESPGGGSIGCGAGGADLAREVLRIDFWTFERVSPPSLVESEPVGGIGWSGVEGVGTLGC